MKNILPEKMKAIAFDSFGGLEKLSVRQVPVPEVGPLQVILQVEWAGVGNWDVSEREGFFAKMYPGEPEFPYILGSEGAGKIVAVGSEIDHLQIGDLVFGHIGARSPKRGFYAEYAAVDAERVWPLPNNLTAKQAATLPIDAGTALRGLRDVLDLRRGETIMIFGASGGIGHFALQMAKSMGAHVLSVASGQDGIDLAWKLGSDKVVDGHTGDILDIAHGFAPGGLDTALFAAGGTKADHALAAIKEGGRVAYPNGIQPLSKTPANIHIQNYNANNNRDLIDAVLQLNSAYHLKVHVSRTFVLDQAAEAQRFLKQEHYIGRIALSVGSEQ